MCDLLQFGNISRCIVLSKFNKLKGRVLNVTETAVGKNLPEVYMQTENGCKGQSFRIIIIIIILIINNQPMINDPSPTRPRRGGA